MTSCERPEALTSASSIDGLDPLIAWNFRGLWAARLSAQLEPSIPTLIVRSSAESVELLHRYSLAPLVVACTPGDDMSASVSTLARTNVGRPIAMVRIGNAQQGEDHCCEATAKVRLSGVTIFELRPELGPRGLSPLVDWVQVRRFDRLAAHVWSRIEHQLPDQAGTLYRAALRQAHDAFNVLALSNACGCTERTLHRYCKVAQVGPPLRLIVMSRLLTAGFLLERPGSRVDAVASRLRFESVDALRMKVLRWTGLSLRDLRKRGWIASLVPHLLADPR